MSWQPIETAPKDHTRILVYCPDEGEVHEAFWSWPYFGDENVWCVNAGGYGDPIPLRGTPTHWMPMPAPPSEGDTPTPPDANAKATVSVEAYEQLRKEITEMAQESVRRELALAKLEAEVIALREAYTQSQKEVQG